MKTRWQPIQMTGLKGMIPGFAEVFATHSLTCPCGASLHTDSDTLAEQFIKAHAGHAPAAPGAPRTEPS